MLAADLAGIALAAFVGAHGDLLSLMVMFGLIPLANIPFDAASVGLTRALLRRGCEPGSPSPLWWGLLDFFFGFVLSLLLALALIAALQIADGLIVREGGKPVANAVALLDHIRDDPRDAGNYWAYFTLFSTLIPSALNAVIGAVSLIGWWWGPARRWVLARLPLLDEAGHIGTRRRIAALLGLQVGLGTALVCLALWGLWEALLEAPYVLPVMLALLKHFALLLA
jgi:hypothetical protein